MVGPSYCQSEQKVDQHKTPYHSRNQNPWELSLERVASVIDEPKGQELKHGSKHIALKLHGKRNCTSTHYPGENNNLAWIKSQAQGHCRFDSAFCAWLNHKPYVSTHGTKIKPRHTNATQTKAAMHILNYCHSSTVNLVKQKQQNYIWRGQIIRN